MYLAMPVVSEAEHARTGIVVIYGAMLPIVPRRLDCGGASFPRPWLAAMLLLTPRSYGCPFPIRYEALSAQARVIHAACLSPWMRVFPGS